MSPKVKVVAIDNKAEEAFSLTGSSFSHIGRPTLKHISSIDRTAHLIGFIFIVQAIIYAEIAWVSFENFPFIIY